MSRKALFKTGRRVAALGAASLGACAVLAACSPVQMGAAAIVGNQRITTTALDTQVSGLQAAVKHYGSAIPSSAPVAQQAQQPRTVLSWLIRFAVMDEVAASKGISVTQAQSQAALSALSSRAAQNGMSTSELLVANGLSPQMFAQLGRYQAQLDAFVRQVNGGKEPTTQTQVNTINNAINKSQCAAAKTLNIQVSPQFGRFDYASTTFGVVPGANLLSRPGGTPTPASTEGLTPAAC